MTPCSSLFGNHPINVLTYPSTDVIVQNGLGGLTASPNLTASQGLLFYTQTSGTSSTGGSLSAPTWVLQAGTVNNLAASPWDY
jgi:hypothetical protein